MTGSTGGGDRAGSAAALRAAALREGPAQTLAYLIALLVSGAAVAGTILTPLLHPRPYLLSFGAVTLSAWIGGFRPALLATLVTGAGVNVFLARSQQWQISHLATGAVFLGLGTLVAYSVRTLTLSEREAKRQSARLAAMFGQAAVGIGHLTLAGGLVRINQRMADLVGRPVQQVQQMTYGELTHPGDRATVAAALADLSAGRRAEFSSDLRCLRPDGTAVWTHVSVAPLFDDDGRPESLIAVVENIHERRTAEERARISEERAGLALDVAQLGTWSWVTDAAPVEADERTREMCGLPALGRVTLAEVMRHVHPDDRTRIEEALARASASGDTYAEEFRFVHDDGSLRWVVSRGQVVPSHDGADAPRVMLGSMLDITARRMAEDALKLADRQKDDFLALLSHELRNPLAPIRTAVHLLKLRHAPDADSQRLHAVIERQVEHLVRLVDDLLDVSRVLRGKIELRPETLDVAEVVGMAVETTRPMIDARRQQLRLDLPAAAHVHGDQVRLAQVVGNLLHNASKFTDRGGSVALTVAHEGPQVVLRVEDTGAGIAPEVLPTIFEPFVQADRSLERSQGGLGIGLTLVRKIVELHGGTVTARSAGLGRGSEFVVRLPAAVAPEAQAPGAATAPAPPPHWSLRLLVVDDNVDAAESLAALLRTRGQVVTVAHNGPDALARALEWRPDVVLLDIGLPGMNGYEVAAALKREPGGAPALVALTGYGQDADARRAADAGFDRHLVKPVDAAQLERVIAAVVARASPPA